MKNLILLCAFCLSSAVAFSQAQQTTDSKPAPAATTGCHDGKAVVEKKACCKSAASQGAKESGVTVAMASEHQHAGAMPQREGKKKMKKKGCGGSSAQGKAVCCAAAEKKASGCTHPH